MSRPSATLDQANARADRWRQRCRELDAQLVAAKSRRPYDDEHEATIEYCLHAAETLVEAAKTLVQMRLRAADKDTEGQ